MTSLKHTFEQIGGTFLVEESDIARDLNNIKAYIFDWDGVFNNGVKSFERGSEFSEPDAMGLNMLRFNHWRIHGEMPFIFIITGENNTTAIEFAKREHLNAVYMKFANKREALKHISSNYNLTFDEMVFTFDDILDVDACSKCMLSFCVKRNSSPLFKQYIIERNVCQYITGTTGGNHAVREVCELIIGLTGQYDATISRRIAFEADYINYLSERKLIVPSVEVFTQ